MIHLEGLIHFLSEKKAASVVVGVTEAAVDDLCGLVIAVFG